jgi:hypothetical protein
LGKQHYFNGCAPIFLGNNLSPRSNFFYIWYFSYQFSLLLIFVHINVRQSYLEE